jgi:DNA-binding MarR family transcriptional regulator
MPASKAANDEHLEERATAAKAFDDRLAAFHREHGGGEEGDLYYRVTRDIVVAGRHWRKLANERIKLAGQTMARWETLFLVAFSDHALTQSELAPLIGVEGPTLVRMLDLLAQEGLIERRQNEMDRRMTTNTITDAGRAVIVQMMGITNVLRAEVMKDIDPGDLDITLRTLNQIIDRLDEMR